MQWPPNMTVRPIQSWPGELTTSRKRSNFKASWSDTIELLRRELRAINATNVVLQVAMQKAQWEADRQLGRDIRDRLDVARRVVEHYEGKSDDR